MAQAQLRRYFNRRTLLIEHADPVYAAQVRLAPWEGQACPTEVDKAGVEYASVAADIDTLKKPELVARAQLLGLDFEGTADDIRDRIDEFAAPILARYALVAQPVDDTELHGTPAVGDDETESPKEG